MPATSCPDKGISILFQQQQFLETHVAEKGHGSKSPCFTTLMQDWVSSYQKTRVRARMACRPLWGEGSDVQLNFPKPPPPARPVARPLSAPTRRNLDEELEELEEALQGPLPVRKASSGSDDKSRTSRRSTQEPEFVDIMQTADRPFGFSPSPEKRMTLMIQVNDGTVAAKALTEAVHGPTSPRSEHGGSTVMRDPSLYKEGSAQHSGGEGASTEGGDAHSLGGGDEIMTGPAARMMPRKDVIHKVFSRLANDGEVHKDSLETALELMGIRHAREDWLSSILDSITRYTTLNFHEYLRLVKLYLEKQSLEYEKAFYHYDRDGSGSIEAAELTSLLEEIGITPMDQVISELTAEHDLDNSGELDLGEFCSVLAVINEREGFTKAEYERFKHAYNLYDDEQTGALETDQLLAILGYLGYEMNLEAANRMLEEVDVDGSGALSFSEFLIFMRKIRDQEVQRLEDELERLSSLPAGDKEDLLTGLLRIMGYVPDKEAVRDAAIDSNINLAKPTVRRASLVQMCMPNSVKPPSGAISATPTYKSTVTLSEAYRFLEVYRCREGFTRAEAAELQEHYNRFAQTPGPADTMFISSYDSARALTWLGYRSSHEEHQLTFSKVDVSNAGSISLAEFLKLVRLHRQQELEEIRASFLRIGLAGQADPTNESKRAAQHSMAFLGMGRAFTDKAKAREDDQRYGVLRMAVSKRSQMRALAQQHQGFSAEEVEGMQCRFSTYDSDGSGTISASELRLLCQEMLPEIATDPKSRPELIRLVKETDSSGDGKLNFHEFLKLMRDLEDSQRLSKFIKEKNVLDQLPFTKHQIRDFRELFLEHDSDREDVITFKSVQSLLTILVPMGDRRVLQLAEIWHKNVDVPRKNQDLQTWTLDFPDFLMLMHALLEADFCGIKAKSAAAAFAKAFLRNDMGFPKIGVTLFCPK
ncbi:CML1 [Symbiodinium natans]|uniref:CML1 protein n=1 Tax=Symbiodinium natans TaxID=878477 RepID=A0A812JQ43_9DINO|nr:CML1 [Symbiodinium natans]